MPTRLPSTRLGAALAAILAVVTYGRGAITDGAASLGGQGNPPRLEAISCPATVPADPRISCAVLTVPENRGRPRGTQVRLPVATIHSTASVRAPDPILFLSGGPGDSALESAARLLASNIGGTHDLILMDQRGSGSSQPNLNCPELKDATWTTFAQAASPEREYDNLVAAARACRARLVATGVDLNAYTTDSNSDDFSDLIAALGVNRVNLWSGSYGTTLALDIMRRHPAHIRSVVLDSVDPTTVGVGGTTLAAKFTAALGRLYGSCASTPACAAKYPNLEADTNAVVDDLNAHPYETTVTDPTTGQPHNLVITGDDAFAGLFYSFYNSALIPSIPSAIEDFRAGRRSIIGPLALQAIQSLNRAAEGMYLSVDCADRASIDTRSGIPAVLHTHPHYSTVLTVDLDRLCPVWHVRPAPKSFVKPVRSAIPTLILAGQFDAVTPPVQGRSVARYLSRSTFVEFPGLGHGVVFADPCPVSVFESFLAAPASRPDTTCVTTMHGPAWK